MIGWQRSIKSETKRSGRRKALDSALTRSASFAFVRPTIGCPLSFALGEGLAETHSKKPGSDLPPGCAVRYAVTGVRAFVYHARARALALFLCLNPTFWTMTPRPFVHFRLTAQ